MRPDNRRSGGRGSSLIIVAIFALLVFLYLVFALINPEKF
ncbi:potassium-transporting ATPase subunit F [Paenibacillus rhizosphaerae]